ncbi:ecto-ADP-ribosyltransferase 5-like [Varanus komodoensis]|uniref:ecto-ADP-ribosyltransferase 5-like n=1 Tax=Varanus komodoensis TaxID=61221 RepID=UPI001CF76AF8|nr:ecto-ADP-ribosyltransferase 5-like [Varanus komodoensis]
MSTNKSNPELNMACYSLDDWYKGCMASTESHLTALIQNELSFSKQYNEAWNQVLILWQTNQSWLNPRNVTELSEVAIWAYTIESPPLHRAFNAATCTAGKGPEEYGHYPFKSLHFLLTRTSRLRRPKNHKCAKVYRGVSVEFSVRNHFRFGQFTSTSLDQNMAKKFQSVTFFKLFTCKGIEISEMSIFEYEEEVLVPLYEIFNITSIKDTSKGKMVVAKSMGTCSFHNCAFMGKGNTV